MLLAIGGSIGASMISLSQQSTVPAALVCTLPAVTGGYIALFHNARLVMLNVAVSMVTAILVTIRLAHDIGVVGSLAAFWIIGVLNLLIPVIVRQMSTAMTRYAIYSVKDPLTTLLNRRGFLEVVGRRIKHQGRGAPWSQIGIALVDLDDFKRVNDTFGHAAGDRALRHVAEVLRTLCRLGLSSAARVVKSSLSL